MPILALETSCDETAVVAYDLNRGILAEGLESQAFQAQFGGVVPELASRDHLSKLLPMIQQVIDQANLSKNDIEAIAYTAGPGLVGALLVGASLACSLAYAWQLPVIPVNHLEGHLLAAQLDYPALAFPFLSLLASGGHTLLAQVNQLGQYTLLGETLDDAAGEAFDKTAKILGLPYPGGPELAALATKGKPGVYQFPRPMMNRPGLDFSFSGLKTAVVQAIEGRSLNDQDKADVACAFQEAVVDTLMLKCQRTIKQTQAKCLVLAGGVVANQALRAAMDQLAMQENVELYYPSLRYCTDNAAMIAHAGALRFARGEGEKPKIYVDPRWSLFDV